MLDKLNDMQLVAIRERVASSMSSAPTVLEGLRKLMESMKGVASDVFTDNGLQASAASLDKLDIPVASRVPWSVPKDTQRGLFVVFEGLDRSGKSTQSKRLTKRFEDAGDKVRWTAFPNRTLASGILIDLYLRKMIEIPDEAIHLLFSANRWETAATIVEDLASGVTIICDRYAFSGVAYSAAKGLDFKWCQSPDIGLPMPDCAFFLHLSPEVGKTRANFGDERYENHEMQSRVREEFQRTELHAGVNWRSIDASRDMDDISAEIGGTIDDIIVADRENVHRPLKRLWVS
eukprot:gnl/MRDRNA2_/MRDRNA2_98459_c0_seq1.p1 gnl/MRDRNA2_/MRDRNA2_98459_c0~~gnl/MRDRNA2_/MRDRNA2_98459_c0_seq1.p1  ORF type:complete len:290 (-),score=58.49 gnl/MRDRNA2_/MRDRNA2_98459_c0_seq1:356-1225(-)